MAWAPVRLVIADVQSALMAYAVSREVLPVAVSCRRRVILMDWRAQGKSSPLTWAVLRVRVSMRPCPVSQVELPTGTCRQGQGPDAGVQQRLVFLHHGDVMGFLVACQAVQVRPHRPERGYGGRGERCRRRGRQPIPTWMASR